MADVLSNGPYNELSALLDEARAEYEVAHADFQYAKERYRLQQTRMLRLLEELRAAVSKQ